MVKIHSEACDLCGLPLRSNPIHSTISDKHYRFCCRGCRQVFQILFESSDTRDPAKFRQTDLFRKCREIGIIPQTEADLPRNALSRPSHRPAAPIPPAISDAARSDTAQQPATDTLSLQLKISNMWCPACAWVIGEALKRNPGVVDADCNFSTDRLRCEYNPVETAPDKIINIINSLGYKTIVSGAAGTREKRAEFIRFGISAFVTVNVMMLSFALYSGFFSDLSRDTIAKLSWPLFFMTSVVLFYGGRNIFKKALAGFASAAASMETLIAIGSLSAYIYSIFNLLTANIHLYFDTAAMLITLVLLGKILERGAKNKIQSDLENFSSLLPTKVKITTASHPEGRYVAAQHLRPQDIFVVQTGEIVAADGCIIKGSGSVDESSLTGEALPIPKKSGDRLRSGTTVIGGNFTVRAEGLGRDSILGQMIEIMEKALAQKTPLEGRTNRILQWFVPAILTLAVTTAVVCRYLGLSLEQSLVRAITVMVISCPCALGVAIPLARVAGISVAARMGLLVRDFSAFEQARRVDSVVFDKTGTITQGQWKLKKILTFDSFSETRVLALAAALETTSDHYIALQIKQRALEQGVESLPVENITIHENGVSGRADKAEVKIGSKNFLAPEIAAAGYDFQPDGRQFDLAPSLVYLGCDGRLAAVFIFGDTLRKGTSAVIKKLRTLGYSLAIVSGDGEHTTRIIGGMLEIESAHGGLLPPAKAKFIEDLRKNGRWVAMVGDGINDAPALARADLAVAVHSGSHLGKEVADLILMRGEPVQLLDFLKLAHRVNQKVIQNFICAFVYNILSIPIAMSGLLNPPLAVMAMLLSSLSVSLNTLLLVKKVLPMSLQPKKKPRSESHL